MVGILGVTGTNGKTTCSYILGQILDYYIIGTLGSGKYNDLEKTINTTPGREELGKLLTRYGEEVVMEVSSHGIEQGRISDIEFGGLLYCRVSSDHLDYHGSVEEYVRIKSCGMERVRSSGYVVLNLDCDNVDIMIEKAKGLGLYIYGYSLSGKLDERVDEILLGTYKDNKFRIKFMGDDIEGDILREGYFTEHEVKSPLKGSYNRENILGIVCMCIGEGMRMENILEELRDIVVPPGRLEEVVSGVYVDYAHTEDALERVLKELRVGCVGNLIVLFGCGGNRDRGKRSKMNGVAREYGDMVVVTSDNSRDESFEQIVSDMGKVGIIMEDRVKAIEFCLDNKGENDIVLLAGKGHEDVQVIGDKEYHHNDKEEVLKYYE